MQDRKAGKQEGRKAGRQEGREANLESLIARFEKELADMTG